MQSSSCKVLVSVYHTVFLVHALYLENELAALYNLKIVLVPQRQGCEFWTWELCQWMVEKAIDINSDDIVDKAYDKSWK